MSERLHWSRKRATIIVAVAMAAVGATAALSNSSMADVTLFGKTMFDLMDYATSNILLPLGGLFICLFVGWRWGWREVREALTNHDALKNERIAKAFYGTAKFVTPVLVLVVLLSGLGVF